MMEHKKKTDIMKYFLKKKKGINIMILNYLSTFQLWQNASK